MTSQPAGTRAGRLTERRFASSAEADRAEREYWLTIPVAERLAVAWRLSVQLWEWRGEPYRPGVCRSVERVFRPR